MERALRGGSRRVNVARRLVAADAEALRALRLCGLKEHPLEFGADYDEEAAWPLERWRAQLADAFWFGVEADGELTACLYMRQPSGRKLRHNGWINAMYVAPHARGAGGAADALMEAAEAEAITRGVTRLKLYVRDGNARAIAFYRRRGFAPYGVEPDSHIVDGVGYHSLEMCKILSASQG